MRKVIIGYFYMNAECNESAGSFTSTIPYIRSHSDVPIS